MAVPLRRLSRFVPALALPLVALAAVACDGQQAKQRAATVVASTPPSPPQAPATPVSTPAPFVLPPTKAQLAFAREGTIFMANKDGLTQLTPDGEEASFVGLRPSDEGLVFFYIAKTGDEAYALLRVDLGTGVTSTMLAIDGPHPAGGSPHPAEGSLSPDGRFVALTGRDGIDVVDLELGLRTPLLKNGRGCPPDHPVGDCFSFAAPRWSPDGGRLLAAEQGWEWVVHHVVQWPSGAEFRLGRDSYDATWSPAGDAVCHWGNSYVGTSLYLARAPEWVSVDLLPGSATPTAGRQVSYAQACGWLDERRLVFVAESRSFDGVLERHVGLRLAVHDLVDGTTSELAVPSLPGEWPFVRIVGVAEGFLILGTPRDGPLALNIADGSLTRILQPGDDVIAILTP